MEGLGEGWWWLPGKFRAALLPGVHLPPLLLLGPCWWGAGSCPGQAYINPCSGLRAGARPVSREVTVASEPDQR